MRLLGKIVLDNERENRQYQKRAYGSRYRSIQPKFTNTRRNRTDRGHLLAERIEILLLLLVLVVLIIVGSVVGSEVRTNIGTM